MNTLTKTPHYTFEESYNSLVFSIPSQKHWFQIIFFSFSLIIWGLIGYWGGVMLFFILSEVFRNWLPNAQEISDYVNVIPIVLFAFLFLAVWMLVGVSRLYSILWQLFGLETIKVARHSIIVHREVIGLKSKRIYQANEINNLRTVRPDEYIVRWYKETHGKFKSGTIALDYRKRTHRFGYGLEQLEAKKILNMIQQKHPYY